MASSRSGSLNYADMLSKGMNASQTNTLLQSVVEYIQEIASTDNKSSSITVRKFIWYFNIRHDGREKILRITYLIFQKEHFHIQMQQNFKVWAQWAQE